jgi:hypothetical protein
MWSSASSPSPSLGRHTLYGINLPPRLTLPFRHRTSLRSLKVTHQHHTASTCLPTYLHVVPRNRSRSELLPANFRPDCKFCSDKHTASALLHSFTQLFCACFPALTSSHSSIITSTTVYSSSTHSSADSHRSLFPICQLPSMTINWQDKAVQDRLLMAVIASVDNKVCLNFHGVPIPQHQLTRLLRSTWPRSPASTAAT